MKSYTHFTLDERKFLQQLLSEGYSFRKIADFLGRNVSSISREVNRNRSKYPPKKKSKVLCNYDKHIYKLLPLVENAFLHLKIWRGIATRYDKNAAAFVAVVQIRCIALWLKFY